MTKRILTAMSGGVDSSVTAALLRKQGHEVEGVTLKLTAGLCCDIGSAQAVCSNLNIPHRVIDAQAVFSRDIISDFMSEYRQGRTPNPCIKCNDLVKFRLLLQYARANGFEYLATGHYAVIEYDPTTARYVLKKGVDEFKDQSYFLYRLTQDQMKDVLFPLGGMRKTDVRTLAHELDLPAASRKESQEICFVPDNDYRAFLKEHGPGPRRPGELAMTDGKVVGKHDGIEFFTVGQRRHLGIAAGQRLYVVRIDAAVNMVVLGKMSDLLTNGMVVSDLNFISGDEPGSSLQVLVKVRYRSSLVPAVLGPLARGNVSVQFEKPVVGVCPGQAAVFYDGDVVVGGGVIEAADAV